MKFRHNLFGIQAKNTSLESTKLLDMISSLQEIQEIDEQMTSQGSNHLVQMLFWRITGSGSQ